MEGCTRRTRGVDSKCLVHRDNLGTGDGGNFHLAFDRYLHCLAMAVDVLDRRL